MESSTNSESSTKKWRGLVPVLLLMMLIIPGMGAVGILAWWLSRQSVASNEVAALHAEIRSRGLPIDDATMMQFRLERLDQSRSQRWMGILDVVRSDGYRKSGEGVPRISLPRYKDQTADREMVVGTPFADQASVDAFLDQWKDLRKSVHETTDGAGAIWTEIQFDSTNTLLPYIDATRAIARLLDLEYENAVRNGDSELALESILAGIGNARSTEWEPIVVSQLVGIANLHLVFVQLKFALENDLFSPDQLALILERLRPLDDFGPSYRIAIAGERAFGQTVFDGLGQSSGSQLGNFVVGHSIDRLTALKIMAQMEAVSTNTLDEFRDQVTVVESNVAKQLSRDTWLSKIDTVMTALTTPSLTGFANAYLRSAMELRMAKAAIGCRLYHHIQGQWPDELDSLSELLPGVDLGPIHPVGPKPFGYRIEESGALTLWGFPLETHDETPEQPIEPAAGASVSQRNELRHLRWKMVEGVGTE